jgi:hypothetical protein
MGKWLLCAQHPSNEFFKDFENALIYASPEDFSEKLKYAEVGLSACPGPFSCWELSVAATGIGVRLIPTACHKEGHQSAGVSWAALCRPVRWCV